MDYKNIHIGSHIKQIAKIKGLSISRACAYLKCSHQDILDMYTKKSLDSDVLLRWCKLLEYNFFMFYHSHLQLYNPKASVTKLNVKHSVTKNRSDYIFRKNLYSPDVIDWLLNKLARRELTVKEVMDRYYIPRTTIYRWKKKRQI